MNTLIETIESGSNESDVRAAVVNVTPQDAEYLLSLNFQDNRHIRTQASARWQAMLRNGEFLAGSPIRVAQNGAGLVLIDGQHRLNAIVESGIPAPLTVIVSRVSGDRGVRHEYARQDTHQLPRSLSDIATALDAEEKLPSGTVLDSYAAAARLILGNFDPQAKPFLLVPKSAIYDKLVEHDREIALTREWFGSGKIRNSSSRGFYRAGVLAVALVTSKYVDEDSAREFWASAYADDGLRSNDPRKRLHDYLVTSSGTPGSSAAQATMRVTSYCWNAYTNDTKIETLRIPKSMPPIALTPYPMKKADNDE